MGKRHPENDHESVSELRRGIHGLRQELQHRSAAHAVQLRDKDVHIRNLDAIIRSLGMQRDLAQRDTNLIRRSWSYRIGRILVSPASLIKILLERRRQRNLHKQPPLAVDWSEARERYEEMTERPKISVVMPVHDTPADLLLAAVASVEGQIYREWELCIADDGSQSNETRSALRAIAARGDERIRFTRLETAGGIARASNAAAELAGGDFLALLDHDDTLEPGALLAMALRIAQVPEADLLYSDEDKIDSRGQFCHPFHKPDFSPEWLLSANYICHLLVIRRSVFDRVGGFREGFDGSQDWDLVLRVSEVARKVEHLPQVLYHWRMIPGSTAAEVDAKGGAWRESSRRVLRSAIRRRGWQARVENGAAPSSYRVRFDVDPSQHVVIIIPTKDRVGLLRRCIESIEARTDHPSYEILVVCNNCEEEGTFAYLDSIARDGVLRYIVHDAPFNFSELNNLAVRETSAPYLCFLNNDIEILRNGWLTSMLEHAQREEIGAVGAKLLYGDNTIQHAGVVLGIGGVAGHIHRGLPAGEPGYFSMASVVRNSSAVTGACLLTRRDVFEEVGGFADELEVAFNDVDLCMRIRDAGYRIVYTPHALAYHWESASRGPDDTPSSAPRFRREIATMVLKWGDRLREDPYYSPNLTLTREDCTPFTEEDRQRFQEQVAAHQALPAIRFREPETDPPADGGADRRPFVQKKIPWALRFDESDHGANAFKIFEEWSTRFNNCERSYGAERPQVTDRDRRIAEWDSLLPVKGCSVLELGPAEGGHTKQMLDLGAAEVVAIEADPEAYLKACLAKNVLGLDGARICFGDIDGVLQDGLHGSKGRRFDICCASAILHHLGDPLRTIDLIVARAPVVYVWVHVATDEVPGGEWVVLEDAAGRVYRGRNHGQGVGNLRSGLHENGVWLCESDVLDAFRDRGCEILGLKREATPDGPALSFVACNLRAENDESRRATRMPRQVGEP